MIITFNCLALFENKIIRFCELTKTLGKNIFSRRIMEFDGEDEDDEINKDDFETSKQTLGGSRISDRSKFIECSNK
jgi:hypothetical protein